MIHTKTYLVQGFYNPFMGIKIGYEVNGFDEFGHGYLFLGFVVFIALLGLPNGSS
jgi:uncharacterized membrane protein